MTALIGPSGCGKSTFLRILNRMHEVVPGAQLAGSVKLDGVDIYGAGQRAIDTRRHIGMVFQKPNPFPAMTIADNVLSGLRFSRITPANRDDLVEEMLTKAGLWNEVKDRLGELGGALSGGQQQRLCIARALAVRPRVLLMDEPCSALDPTSTLRIEQTIKEIADEVTVVIVTHNMQQAQRVSDYCAFFLAEENEPGRVVESGTTEMMFAEPTDQRTARLCQRPDSAERAATPAATPTADRGVGAARGARSLRPACCGQSPAGRQPDDAVHRIELRQRGHPAVGGPVQHPLRPQHQLAGLVLGHRPQQLRPEPGRLRRLRHPLQLRARPAPTPTVPYQYMPDVAGGLAFMYNLTGNDGQQITSLNLDAR